MYIYIVSLKNYFILFFIWKCVIKANETREDEGVTQLEASFGEVIEKQD